MTRTLRFSARLCLALMLVVGHGVALAEDKIDPYYGSFGTSVPLAVPGFHGLEPELQVVYNSGGRNGLVGVGWGLAGFSRIDRAGPTGGAPTFTANDTYRLDGEELIPCAPGSLSPSCSTGGTHSTRIDNYKRIAFDGTSWSVWFKDGTKASYTVLQTGYAQVCSGGGDVITVRGVSDACDPLTCPTGYQPTAGFSCSCNWKTEVCNISQQCAAPAATCASGTQGAALGTLSWGINRIADTRANAVTYTWACADPMPSNTCYPRQIAYNGNFINFIYASRPDVQTAGNGTGFMGSTRGLLRAVDVLTHGARTRAYLFSYTTSFSGNSVLASVQQFGTDAAVNNGYNGWLSMSDVAVTGSALPAMTFSYGGSAPTWADFGTGLIADASGGADVQQYSTTAYPDLNGDGKADLCRSQTVTTGGFRGIYTYSPSVTCWLSTGSSFSTAVAGPAWATDSIFHNAANYGTLSYPDINGDGKSDLCGRNAAGIVCSLSTGAGFGATVTGPAFSDAAGWATRSDSIHFVDLNADGKADVCGVSPTNDVVCALSTGNAFAALFTGPRSLGAASSVTYPDINADGHADVCMLAGAGIRCFLGTGKGLAAGFGSTMIFGPSWGVGTDFQRSTTYANTIRYPDLNGDGKSDVCGRTVAGLECWLSTGNGFTVQYPAGYFAESSGWGDASYPLRFVDFNGDGKADVCGRGASGFQCYASTGQGWGGYFNGPAWSNAAGWSAVDKYSTIQTADVDGDGSPDFCGRTAAGIVCAHLSVGLDLMRTTSNGLGGSTTIGYVPSTTWANTYLPVGMVFQTPNRLTTADGRGASSTVAYSFSGALWSADENRFLGFRRVTSVIDGAGNYTETYYHQHVGCISKPEATYFRDAAGNPYSYTTYTYDPVGEALTKPPFSSLLTDRWDFECGLSPSGTRTCRRVISSMTYDVYGNVTRVYEYGDYDLAGDERTSIRAYSPNTQAYIVNKPAYEAMLDAIGNYATFKEYWYDNAANRTVAPTVGNATTVLAWQSGTGAFLGTSYTYDGAGNVTRVTDPLGNFSTTTYDTAYGVYPVRQCNALAQCVDRSWNTNLGLPTFTVDANAFTTTTNYDVFGRLTNRTGSDGHWLSVAYLNFGQVNLQHTRVTESDGSSDGLWKDEYFDGLLRTYKLADEAGRTQETYYSDSGSRTWKLSQPHLSSEPARLTEYAYDGAGRRVTEIHPDGKFARISYGVGRATIIDELGHQTIKALDAYGRVTDVWKPFASGSGPDTSSLNNRYDVLGHIVQTTDAAGNVSSATYDSLGRRIAECDQSRGCSSATYDANGHLLTTTNARGLTVSMTYDALGRMRTKSSGGSTTTFTYDESYTHGWGAGRLTTVVDDTGSESFTYNNVGQVLRSTKCIRAPAEGITDCRTTNYTYDVAGRTATITYPDGEVVTNSYDVLGRLSGIAGYVSSISYNSRDQMTGISYTNATSETYTYNDDRGELLSADVQRYAYAPSLRALLYQSSYTYDDAARVTSRSSTLDGNLNLTFSYDDLNRLTLVNGAQVQAFAYDRTGNLTYNSWVGSYGYAAANKNAVTTAGANSYSYDASGNLVAGSGPQANGFSAVWDAENRPVTITRGGVTTNNAYDWAGRRVVQWFGGTRTSYFGQLFEVTNGGVVTKYVYANGRLVSKKANTGWYFYHQDHIGSVQLITDAWGSVVSNYHYSAFGNSTGGGIADATRFTSQKSDDSTGLIYMNARYYDPVLARFISADTIVPDAENPQALNRYSYAYNNPISNSDPTGHLPVALAFVTALSVAAEYQVLAWVAFAVTTVGYVTHNEFLMTVGSIMMGGASGGAMGAMIAALTSPLSPLDPKLKQAIGWAFTAYGYASRAPASGSGEYQVADNGDYDDSGVTTDSPQRVEVTGTKPPPDQAGNTNWINLGGAKGWYRTHPSQPGQPGTRIFRWGPNQGNPTHSFNEFGEGSHKQPGFDQLPKQVQKAFEKIKGFEGPRTTPVGEVKVAPTLGAAISRAMGVFVGLLIPGNIGQPNVEQMWLDARDAAECRGCKPEDL